MFLKQCKQARCPNELRASVKICKISSFEYDALFSKKRFGAGLDKWINYIRDDYYYQIIKNIVCLKECNLMQCRKKDTKLLKCSRCVSVFYCSKKCQKRDWTLRHKDECIALKKRDYNLT